MKKITVVLTKRKNNFNLLSWIIRFIEHTEFSHIGFVITNSTGRKFIYEASGFTVKFNNYNLFNDVNLYIKQYELELSSEQQQKFIDICLDNLGRPYSIKGLIGLLFVRLFKLKSNPFKDQADSFVCSELAAFIIKEFYPEALYNYDLDTVGLKEIDRIIKTIALKEL